MTILWKKDGTSVDDALHRFMNSRDVEADRELFLFDIHATAAHVRGLGRIGLLSDSDVSTLCAELSRLGDRFSNGEFLLDERFEDAHSAIEFELTATLGELGRRVHAGRSRNDQVQVALRLYMKDRLVRAHDHICDIAKRLLTRAEREHDVPMPGYTHLQRAVPSSAGLWLAGIAESFLDSADACAFAHTRVDSCPLGTAAGYGVNLRLDRQGVSTELEFARLQVNPLAVQNARGKYELAVLDALGSALLDVRRFAWDLSLFATSEFGFVTFASEFTTGSSIMPNKRNPDVVELLRTSSAEVEGARTQIAQTLSLPSGYQRDLQATKAPFIRAVETTLAALVVTERLVDGFALQHERMRAAIDADMFATDRAVELVTNGVAFRDAYLKVARDLGALWDRTPEESLVARVSPGACADLCLDELQARLGLAINRLKRSPL